MATGSVCLHSTIKVFTIPDWAFSCYNEVTNSKHTAELRPVLDANGSYILSTNVLQDSTWNFYFENTCYTDPNTLEEKSASAWLTEASYSFIETPSESFGSGNFSDCSVFMDFGSSTSITLTGSSGEFYNNINNTSLGFTSSLLNSVSESSGISYTSINGFGGTQTLLTSTTFSGLPASIWQESVCTDPSIDRFIRFSGFSPSQMICEIVLTGTSDIGNKKTDITINGVTKTYDAAENKSTQSVDGPITGAVYFDNIMTDISGNLYVTMSVSSGSNSGHLSWIKIEEYCFF